MRTLKKGSTGIEVVVCQTLLNAMWMTDDAGLFLETDGVFGSSTLAAVTKFQRTAKTNGLYDGEIDGIFGPKCWKIVGYGNGI